MSAKLPAVFEVPLKVQTLVLSTMQYLLVNTDPPPEVVDDFSKLVEDIEDSSDTHVTISTPESMDAWVNLLRFIATNIQRGEKNV